VKWIELSQAVLFDDGDEISNNISSFLIRGRNAECTI
jgi:hypothetical protein